MYTEVLPKDRAEDLVELTTLRMGYNMLGKKQAGFNHFVTSAPVYVHVLYKCVCVFVHKLSFMGCVVVLSCLYSLLPFLPLLPPLFFSLSFFSFLPSFRLRTVDATENGLSLIPPPRAWRSCGLKDLRLNGNEITQLDLQDCEKYWPHLETLYIGQNKLREV